MTATIELPTTASTLVFDAMDCSRCGGSGRMPFAAYGGVCFKCNGAGRCLTSLGKSARKLFDQLIAEVTDHKQAWEVEVGERIETQPGRYATVVEKDFSSRTGGVVNGRCLGSAMLSTAKMMYCFAPDWPVAIAPSVEARRAVIAEVVRRRRGATLVAA